MFLKEYFEKINFEKSQQTKYYPACKEFYASMATRKHEKCKGAVDADSVIVGGLSCTDAKDSVLVYEQSLPPENLLNV